MPAELTQRNGSVEFWSKDVSYEQLQKFWDELSQEARQGLLRIDKQALFEKARNIMFCSRCHGFLLEEFSQIVMYGKSSQQEGDVGHLSCNRQGLITKFQNGDGLCNVDGCQCDDQDPYIHPWGCLTISRDGALTLLDCYLFSTSLKGIQNVFDNARARERERKLINPNACGVGGRRWKGPGSRETCAVHNTRLPLEKMVEFWSALGKESRQSLLKMKEEDFMERLVYRFDRKKFCKDCRKNVVREFKELKELMRMRKEPGFQCEISHDTIQADWSHTFTDTHGTYHHFEWAIGSEKGKSDISPFENVGLSGIVQVNGLDLRGLDACYVTLRAWKADGDCTEFSVKAHTLKGQQCVHRRLSVGDGFVTITEGEGIRDFFKHAEDVVKEDLKDDELVENDGKRLDGECSRTQKHAKSPELAREFLLDAATVIFKEQVEKAFRERIARQNAHSVFVSFALKLVEERVHVACKEILTLEKQMKLLEEEVKEKNEEEERKERRRIKEREKKLRRKERTRENEKDRDDCSLTNQHIAPDVRIQESTVDDEKPDTTGTGKVLSSCHVLRHIKDEQQINGRVCNNMDSLSDVSPDENLATSKDKNDSSESDFLKYSGRKLKNRYQQDTTLKCSTNRQPASISGSSAATSVIRASDPKFHKKVQCSNRMSALRGDLQAHSCCQHSDYKGKVEPCCTTTQSGQKYISKTHSASLVMSKTSNLANKLTLGDYITDSCGRPKLNFVAENIPSSRLAPQSKQVGEPIESKMKYIQSYFESDVTVRSSTLSGDAMEPHELEMGNKSPSAFHLDEETCQNSKELVDSEIETCSYSTGTRKPSNQSTSSCDSCSSCLNEVDSSRSSSNPQITEPLSTLNLDDASQKSKEREASQLLHIGIHKFEEAVLDKKQIENVGEPIRSCSLDKSRIYVPAIVPQENVNRNHLALHSHKMQMDVPTKQDPMQTKPNASVEKNFNNDISQANNKAFSLFHFGGPFGLADAYKSDSLLVNAVGGLSLTKSIHNSEGDLTCNTKDFIQEYNLFASCKGITFPIF